MDNLELYNKVRQCPQDALKSIEAGRLKGMSDINPMWRIKTLTEQFGVCGFGWKYTIVDKWIVKAPTGEEKAFVEINLFVKMNGEWSEAIPGTGGSGFVSNERNGQYVSDECYKMALTDAIGVACKSLGIAADVYWQKDRTKYTQPQQGIDGGQAEELKQLLVRKGYAEADVCTKYKVKWVKDLTPEQFSQIKIGLDKLPDKEIQ